MFKINFLLCKIVEKPHISYEDVALFHDGYWEKFRLLLPKMRILHTPEDERLEAENTGPPWWLMASPKVDALSLFFQLESSQVRDVFDATWGTIFQVESILTFMETT